MLRIQAQQDAERQMAMDLAAAEKGMQNASRPTDKSSPDAPQAGGGDMQTQNQPGDQSVPDRQ
jgi:hypothetical protein